MLNGRNGEYRKRAIRLKHRRERCGVSQYEIAKRLGISRSGYANLENGHRNMTIEWARLVKRALRS